MFLKVFEIRTKMVQNLNFLKYVLEKSYIISKIVHISDFSISNMYDSYVEYVLKKTLPRMLIRVNKMVSAHSGFLFYVINIIIF